MISDVLFHAEESIKKYLEDMPYVYEGELKDDILVLLKHMREVRFKPGMDTPPIIARMPREVV